MFDGLEAQKTESNERPAGTHRNWQEQLLKETLGSHDIREDPEAALRVLCDAIELPFSNAMLSWPAGPKPYDGVWASHWYGAVHRSTGFARPEGALPELDGEAEDLCGNAIPHYEALKARKLLIGS